MLIGSSHRLDPCAYRRMSVVRAAAIARAGVTAFVTVQKRFKNARLVQAGMSEFRCVTALRANFARREIILILPNAWAAGVHGIACGCVITVQLPGVTSSVRCMHVTDLRGATSSSCFERCAFVRRRVAWAANVTVRRCTAVTPGDVHGLAAEKPVGGSSACAAAEKPDSHQRLSLKIYINISVLPVNVVFHYGVLFHYGARCGQDA